MEPKKTDRKEIYRLIIPLVLAAGLFLAAGYFAQSHADSLREFVASGGMLGAWLYVAATVVAIVLAPLTTVPLIPLAVQVWGIFLTGVLSIAGWTIGSLIAFWIARRYGAPAVSKFESLDRIRETAGGIPPKNIFWYLLFLRMTVPVDILSYALGLFTGISWKMFFATTLVGISPMAFVLAYFGTLNPFFQVFGMAVGLGAAVWLMYRRAGKR